MWIVALVELSDVRDDGDDDDDDDDDGNDDVWLNDFATISPRCCCLYRKVERERQTSFRKPSQSSHELFIAWRCSIVSYHDVALLCHIMTLHCCVVSWRCTVVSYHDVAPWRHEVDQMNCPRVMWKFSRSIYSWAKVGRMDGEASQQRSIKENLVNRTKQIKSNHFTDSEHIISVGATES